MKLISEAGDKAFLGSSVYFAAHWLGKTEGYTVMTAFSLSVTFLGMLKLLFTEGRPFFVDPSVTPASCKDLEYGFPSGHATVSTATYLTLLYCMSQKIGLLRDNLILQLALFVIVICAIFLVCFSRLFMGVHSMDQLLIGFFVGLAIAVWLSKNLNYEMRRVRM